MKSQPQRLSPSRFSVSITALEIDLLGRTDRPTLQVRRVERVALVEIETRSLPTLTRCFPRNFTFYVAAPVSSVEIDSCAPAHLYLARSRSSRPLPRGCTGHVARPSRSIETCSLPSSLAATHRGFALITRTASCSRQLP